MFVVERNQIVAETDTVYAETTPHLCVPLACGQTNRYQGEKLIAGTARVGRIVTSLLLYYVLSVNLNTNKVHLLSTFRTEWSKYNS